MHRTRYESETNERADQRLNPTAANRRRVQLVAAAAAAVAAVLLLAAPAFAAVGDLTWQDCVTGETESGPGGSGACAEIPSATSGGAGSGLNNTSLIAVSSDGASLYVAARSDDAVARFDRDPDTGDLTFEECITGNTNAAGSLGSGACAEIPSATSNGVGSGLDLLQSMALSANGRSLYVASASDDAVASFDLDPDGELSYEGCITGSTTGAGSSGTGACAEIPTATSGAGSSGLNGVESLAVSDDGHSLYAAAPGDGAVARFDRGLHTGDLTYENCITGDTTVGVACAEIPTATSGSANSGLSTPQAVAVSADGGSVYAADGTDDGAARFGRDPDTGELAYEGCITAETQSGPGGSGACAGIPTATANATDSGLDGPESIALSDDSRSLYTGSSNDDAVARFDRDPDTGELTYQDCITGETQSGPGGSGACAQIPSAASGGTNSGLDSLESIALSAPGASLYATAPSDDSVASFDRDPETGELTYEECITSETQSGPGGSDACTQIPDAAAGGDDSGLDTASALAVSADGRSLYASASTDDAVSRLERQATPLTAIDAAPPATSADPTPTFAFSSDTPGSTFECQVDAGAFVACASPHTTFTLADGPHAFKVRALDAAGNADPNPPTDAFTVDTTPTPTAPGPEPDTTAPDTELTSEPASLVNSKKKQAKLSFEFASSESGSTFLCSLDGSKYFGCDSAYEATVKAKKKAKPHSFRVRAVDAAGNADFSSAKWTGDVKRKKKKTG